MNSSILTVGRNYHVQYRLQGRSWELRGKLVEIRPYEFVFQHERLGKVTMQKKIIEAIYDDHHPLLKQRLT